MREPTIMTAAITMPASGPVLRPFVVDDQGDTYLVCAPDASAVREVARDRRQTTKHRGPGVRITELAMTLVPEGA